jgi:hypothetical protein
MINHREEVELVDWESSDLYGMPGRDLIYFMMYMSLYLDGNWEPENIHKCYFEMLDRSTITGTVFNECITYYCLELGIPESTIMPLRSMTWITHLLENYKKHISKPTERVDLKTFYTNLFFILLEADVSKYSGI